MADFAPPATPSTLTEVEQVEIASALSFHFDDYECREELEDQYNIVCAVVGRIIMRRAEAGAR